MNEKRFSKKAILILAIVVASGLGVSTAVFGIMNIISANIYYTLINDYQNLSEDYYKLSENYTRALEEYVELDETYYILTGNYTELQGNYNSLVIDYDNLTKEFSILQEEYNELQENYINLQIQYDNLLDEYISLQGKYDTLNTYISALILPAQYLVFAEAVRRYYTSLYLGGTTKEWYMGYVEFCRDIVLHDAYQKNSFQNVSNALSECLIYGNYTMDLADIIMYQNFYPWLPNWYGWGLTGIDNLTDIDTIHQWCIDEIDYEYDSDITGGQEDPTWDYPKFPVETAFRTMGDCEDQAILDSAYLESCGFETMIAMIHDPNHPTEGSFYHGSLLVHIEDPSAFYAMYPLCGLWRFDDVDPYYPEYTWCWLDPTWDVPFGNVPSWLADYGGSISYSVCSIAV